MLKRVFSLFLCLVLLISAVPVQVFADGSDGGNIIVGGACVHNGLQHVGAAAPGCIDAGMTEHWHCPDCGSYWLDQDLLETTTKDALPIAALGHKWGNWEVIKAASCTVSGTEQRTCSGCGQTESRDIPATGEHVFGNWEVSKAATCTEKGQEVRKCACGETETREIAALGHKWGQWVTTKEPTCTQEGVSTRTCETCKATETQPIAATGVHTFGAWEVSKAATCTEKGQEVRKCACGETETRELAALGHKWGQWVTTKEPTCTQEGVSTRTCETCKATETQPIAATGKHVFGNWEVSKAATCTDKGQEVRKCACGETETRELPATGHSWGDWAVTKAATCTAEGQETRTCGSCGQQETRKIPKIGHVDADKNGRCEACGGKTNDPSVDPVGSEFHPDQLIPGKEIVHNLLPYNSGYWYHWIAAENGTIIISAKGESLVMEVVNLSREDAQHVIDQVAGFGSVSITHTLEVKAGDEVTVWVGTRNENAPNDPPAATVTFKATFEKEKVCPHSWSDWTTTKAATCTAAGEAERKCGLCGISETKVLPATGVHVFGDWQVTKAATCTAAGEEVRKCGSCDAAETRAIAALGHNWGQWVTTKEPTCTQEGVSTRTCETCKATETQPIAATGVHTFGAWEVSKAATCTEKGQEVRKCGCGETETREIAALGHKWGEWTVTKAPTCTVDGVESRTCANCKETETKAIPATGEHVFGNWEVSKAATCTEKGEEARKCGCGETETREIAAIGHKWGEWAVTKAPTCTVDGVESRTCANCKETETKAIPATGEHVFGNWEVSKAATCTEKGQEVRKCGCGETETREIAAIGHNWGEWAVTKAPTCTVDGVESRTCANCKETETKTIPATGEHVFGNWEVSKAATCTEKGQEVRKCGCGETETREIPALGHNWGEWVTTKAPTCTVDGVESRTCANCKETETKTIPATGEHVFGNWEVTKAATCTEKGEEARKCGCGETETREIPALGHSWGDWTVTKAPTCTVDGVESRTCANCKETETKTIPATGEHVFGNWEVSKAATCTEKGQEVRKCGCGETETREIAALGHKWGDWTVTKAPTCTVDGVETRTCANCKETETKAIPATGEHVFGNWEVTKAATCTEKGEEFRKCGCGETETREIPALGHKWGEWVTTKAPTCTVDGVESRTCANCKETETKTIPATGEHVFGNWEVSKAATCTEKGQEVRKCGCGETETRELAAIGHKWGDWTVTKAPTCTVDGVESRTCANCGETETKAIPATGEHVFGQWKVSKAATCTAAGEEIRSCGCGETETREIPATGHSWGEWKTTKKPGCNIQGAESRTCGNCMETETRPLAALSHSWSDWTVTKAPTCSAAGVETRTCANCGVEEKNTLPATGEHDFSILIELGTGCTDPGQEVHTCKVCGYEKVEKLPAKDHVDADKNGICDACNNKMSDSCDHEAVTYTAAVAASCEKEGKKEFWRCSDCQSIWLDEGKTQNAVPGELVIPALGHAASHVAAVAPGCEQIGNIEYWTCGRCDLLWTDEALTHLVDKDDVALKALGHDAAHVEALQPTCQTQGVLEHWHCSRCDGYWLDQALTEQAQELAIPVDPDAHRYGSWTEHSGTGCTNPGYMDRSCTLCGNVEIEDYPASEHVDENKDGLCDKCGNALADECDHGNVIHVEAKAADCVAAGRIEHWLCQDCQSAWLDEGRTQKAESVTLPALGHAAQHTEAVAATCTQDGNLEYWHCQACDCYWLDEGLTKVTNAEGLVIAALGHKDENADGLCDNCGADLSLGTEGNPVVIVPGEEVNYEFEEGSAAVYYQWTADQDGIFSLALTGEAAAAVSSNGLKPNAADPADKQAQIAGGESIRWEVKAGETVTVSLTGAGSVALNPGFTAQSHEEGTMCNPLVVQGSDAEAAQVKISVAPGTTLYLDVANVRFTWLDVFAREGVRFLLDGVEQTAEDGIVSVTIGKGASYVTIENTSDRTYNTQLSFGYMEGHANNPVTLRLGSQELHLGSQDTLGRWFTWTAPENGKFTFRIEGLTGHDLWQYRIQDQTHNAEEEPPVDTLTLEVTQGQTLTIHVIGYGYAPDKVLGLPGDFRMETSFEDNIPDVPVDPNVIASGSCGENAAWVLDINGVLTVSGKGNVEGTPWQEHKDQILSIVLAEGITGIGDNAFDYCGNLSSVTLPGSLKTIGKDAFNGCAALESLKIPETVETIGENAFAGCAKLSLVVTPDSPAETYAAEYGIPYAYPPAVQSIAVLWKGEDVTDQTVTVDMHDTDTLKLTADLLPQGAEGQVSWKVSDSKLALVENGTVQLKKPGTVTVTATLSGTKLKAAVKLEVLYLDAAKKLTALAEYPAEGLQQGYTARMQVWGQEALDPRALEFSSSDEAMATVEEDGTITAGSKAGTVTITAAIKGDPLKRKVSLKVKIIAKQTHVLRLVPLTQEPAEVTMLDENGNVTEYFDRCAHFVVSIDRTLVEKDSWSFQILPSATGQEGEDVPLTEKSMKWSTSDSRIATVKADKSGLGVVTVKAKTNGACTIQAMSNDLRKTTAYITIHVRSYEPRLASTNLSMNIQSVASVPLGLTESYGNALKEATLHDYDSKTKTYLEEPSSRFALDTADGAPCIQRLSYQKKGTYKLLLKVLCENGETYEYKLSLKVTDTLPTVTVKQLDKFNLFYKESTTRFQLSAKGGALRDAEWIGNDGFRSEFDPETGILTLYYSEAAKEAEAKVSNKGTIRFVFGDYFGSVEKAVTVKTEKKAPKLTMDPAVSVVNTALNGKPVAQVQVWPVSDESMSVSADAPFAEVRGSANLVGLILKENKGGTAYLYVKSDLWMESVKLVHKVKVEDKLPTVQSLPKIVLNQFFTEQDARIAVELSQSNAEIAAMTLESTSNSEAVLAEAAKIRHEVFGTDVLVFALDENDLPEKGSYEFRLNVTLEDGTELAPKTFKVTVEDKVPTVKLKSANLKLNRNLGVFAFAETAVTLPKGYGEYAVVDMVAAEESNDFRVSFEASTGILRADLLNASAASATLQLHPVLKHIPTGQEVTLEKTVALKLTVNAAKPGISLSAKGKLDTIVPDSAIVYTVRKLSNIAGVPEAVRLEGKGAELFNVQLTDDGSQVILTMKDGSAMEKGKTHKLELVFTISGQEVAARVSVKVDQTNLKLAAVKPLNLYHANSRLACVLEVTAPQGARIGDITLNDKSAKQFLQALGADQPLTFTQLQDGRVLLSFKVANPGYLTWGKSYTVYLDITPEGSAANAKPTTVKLTVKTFK